MLNEDIEIHTDLKEYGHSFEIVTNTPRTNTIIIHFHNINSMPQYATDIKNRSILNELKTKNVDIHLWQEQYVAEPKVYPVKFALYIYANL